jgi:hypothetical protein
MTTIMCFSHVITRTTVELEDPQCCSGHFEGTQKGTLLLRQCCSVISALDATTLLVA